MVCAGDRHKFQFEAACARGRAKPPPPLGYKQYNACVRHQNLSTPLKLFAHIHSLALQHLESDKFAVRIGESHFSPKVTEEGTKVLFHSAHSRQMCLDFISSVVASNGGFISFISSNSCSFDAILMNAVKYFTAISYTLTVFLVCFFLHN
jgi:hypothetical protein